MSVVFIGARQRALASLLHEAAHGTLFSSKILNGTIGRVICGWTILQSISAYRNSHVLNHHPNIGEEEDPDLAYMLSEGVYVDQTRTQFITKFLIAPLVGIHTLRYVVFLLRDRLFGNLLDPHYRFETLTLITMHVGIFVFAGWMDVMLELLLFWWLPYITTFAIIGWFSELSEHFPMMSQMKNKSIYASRNRYAAWYERLIIGMHGDNYHLTHHLLPGIPHWNLEKATNILREDKEFRAWDDVWGGVFSCETSKQVSLVKFLIDDHAFIILERHPALGMEQAV